MAERKKKCYVVTCQVDLCAEHEVKVLVKSTKPHLAMDKAVKECYAQGHFQANAIHLKEMNEDNERD